MASTLFASPPSASLPEAIDHFLQAERLKPDGWKENRLFIAKCHIGKVLNWRNKMICKPETRNFLLNAIICIFHIFSTSGLGDYNQAVIWLDKADSIPLASQDVREGIKVSECSGSR